MITDDEVMRLYEEADPARDEPVDAPTDAAEYLDVMRTRERGGQVITVDLEAAPRAPAGHRRLLVAAAAVALVVALAVSGIAISNDDPSHVASSAPTPTTTPPDAAPPRVIPLPPEGAAPSAPVKGVFVLSLQACEGPSS